LSAFVPADMTKAPFVMGARVNRIIVLFTTEHNIKRAGFQYGKSGNPHQKSVRAMKEAFLCCKRQPPLIARGGKEAGLNKLRHL
jgi:hypothetical protein